MDSEVETIKERLDSLLGQLQSECSILERIVYKNKNQHRRCSYFQYLLKVRRELRLLQSAKLEEIMGSCFHVIIGKRPKQKVHLLESLKRRKCEGGNFNFMERLLGAARLLSQMVEPMLKAATEISTLLARSFFMGFSLTILSLLARLRVLVQQILLDVVIVFNMVSILSQKKQSIKITQEGIEVFREFYPTDEDSITLECVWKTDKFVLLEKIHKNKINSQDGNFGGDVSLGSSAVHYQSIESFLGDDALGSKKPDTDSDGIGGPTQIVEDSTDLLGSPSIEGGCGKVVEGCINLTDDSGPVASPGNKISQEGGLLATSSSSASSNSLRLKSGSSKVAFVSVKRPGPSTKNVADLRFKETENNSDDKEDPFFSLLTGGNLKDGLF